MSQEEELIKLIGKKKFDELNKIIPEKFNQDIQVDFSEYLLQKSEQEILDFYSELLNDRKPLPTTKICGSIIILASHIHDLLIKLVETKESDEEIKRTVRTFNLHYLIIFSVARFDIPQEYFLNMIKLKHFRNMVAHDFNSIMETSFHQAIGPITDAHLIIIFLTNLIRK